MSRLTKWVNGEVWYYTKEDHYPAREMDGYDALISMTKLARYEDLEDEGRLIELPCKVGDKVYSVHSAGLSHAVIAEVYTDAFFLMLCVAEGRFGKTVFTTREAAESKLAEMEGAEWVMI